MAAITTEYILSKTYIVYAAQSVQSILYPTAVKVLTTVDVTLRNILGNYPYNKIKFGDFQSSANSFAVSITNIFNGAKLLVDNQITTSSFVNLTIINLGLDKIVSTYVGFIDDVVETISKSLSGIKDIPNTFNSTEVKTSAIVNDVKNTTTDTTVVTTPPGSTDTRDEFDTYKSDYYYASSRLVFRDIP